MGIQALDELPLTVSGKLDRKVLSEIEPNTRPYELLDEDTDGPETLGLVRATFAVALGMPSVAPDMDFFSAGGNSYVSARVINLLRSNPRYQSVNMQDLYRHS